MTRAHRSLALGVLLVVPSVALAQGEPPAGPPQEEKQEEAVAENAEDAQEESEQAEAEAEQADLTLSRAKAQADAAAKAAADAKAAAEAADEKVAVAKTALTAAREAAKTAKEAAAAEGASPEQQKMAAAAAADLEAAQEALAAATAAAEASHERADALQAEADAARKAYDEAVGEAETAKEAKSEAEAKVKAAAAAKEAMQRAAQMKRGPAVPVDVLELKLVPLTKAELDAEVGAWMQVLQTRVTGISYAEIAIKTAQGEEKQQVLEALTKLRSDRTALIDRVEVVLEAYRTKGGETEEQEQYVAAVSGIKVDVKDASAAWTTVTGWLTSPQGGIRWGSNVLLFVITLVIFKIIGSIVGGIATRALGAVRAKRSELLKEFLSNVVRKTVFLIGVVVALSMLEVNIGPFLAAMGGVAFVVGFALQSTLGNFAAGVMILMYRPYDVGDFVEVVGAAGKVAKMSLLSTTLHTHDNQIVVIPNGSILGGVITNKTAQTQRRVDMTFGIGYDDDIAKAEAILVDIVSNHPKVLESPAVTIKLHELADSSVNFIVRPWSKTEDYWDVYWDVTRAVKERFDADGISIPFPQTDVHVHQAAGTASPS